MRIEDKMIRQIDTGNRTSQISKNPSLEKALRIIEKSRLKPGDFSGKFPEEEIKADEARVEKIKKEISNKGVQETGHDRLAIIFEAIFNQHVEVSNWLGDDVVSYKTSEYDDYVNHVDSVLDLGENSEAPYVALGIDVTTGMYSLEKKFLEIFSGIRDKRPVRVKYFTTDKKPEPENARFVRLVIGADIDTVKELEGLWLDGKNSVMHTHFIQHQVIEELLLQCEIFRDYANILNNKEAQKAYNEVFNFLKNIKTTKDLDPQQTNRTKRDKMMQKMRETLEACKQSALSK